VITLYRSLSSSGSYGSSLFFESENDQYGGSNTSYLSQSISSGYTYFIRIAGYWNWNSMTCSYGSIAFSWSLNVSTSVVVPGAPTNVVASGNTNSATVSWSAPSSNGGSIITSYTATSSPGGYTCTTGLLTCTISGLSNFVSYTFTVTARNSAGASSPSVASNSVILGYQNDNLSGALGISAGTTYSNNSAATAETGEPDHAGVAGGKSMWFRYSSTTLKSVSLDTNGSDFDTVLAVYGSTVSNPSFSGLQAVGSNDDDPTGLNGSSAVSFVAQPNVVYYIAVDGYESSNGSESGAITLSVTVETTSVPSAPTRVIAAPLNGGASISWRKPATNFATITSYRVTSNPGGRTCEVAATVRFCTISGLTNGVSYRFSVIATNPAGNSVSSTLSNAVVPVSSYVAETIASEWGIDRIDERVSSADGFLTMPGRGQGTRIYVVDTGVRTTHTEFTNRISSGFSTVADGFGTSDCNGHGTHVASSAAGTTYGVANLATIVPVRVLDCDGSGSTSDVISGLDWVASHIRSTNSQAVVNMSLGGAVDSVLNAAVRSIISLGVPVVAAAGNEARDACNSSPGSEPLAITVAASTSLDEQAGYSNYGSCVDVFAPGSSITAAGIASDASTSVKSGTSMASPHVAGYAAVIKGLFPSASSAAVASAITGTASSNVLTNVSSGTANRLLYTNSAECNVAVHVNIACSAPDSPSAPEPDSPSAPEPDSPSAPEPNSPSIPKTSVPSTPVAPVVTTTAKALTISRSNPATFKSIAMTANLNVPTGAKVTVRVPKSSAKYCKVTAGKITAVKSGTCVVVVTVTQKSSRNTASKTINIKVEK
jgi:hypothetical protein